MSDPTADVAMDGGAETADQRASGDVPPAKHDEVVSSAHAPPIASEDPSVSAAAIKAKVVRATAGKGSAKNGARSGSASLASAGAGTGKFTLGDIVLTKLKGYPLWPSVVVNPEDTPANVQAERPKGSALICTMFFPDGEYSWSSPRDLTPLKPHDIAAYLESGSKKTAGLLFKGYKIAQDPQEFIADKLEAVKAAAAYVDDAADDDEDELAQDEDAGKKRKRSDKKEAPAKKAKTAKEPKSKKAVGEEEDEIEEPASKRKTKAAPKSKKEKTEPKAAAAKDEDADEDDALSKNPEAVKVKEWRHKLQRAFLTKHDLPTAADMPEYDTLFKTIEEYGNMTVEYLAYSKLGKVMKKIAALPNINSNDQYKLTDRATKLMNDWAAQASGGVSETVAKISEAAADVHPAEVIANTASAAVEAVTDAAVAVKEAVEPIAETVVEGAKDLVNGAVEQMHVDEKEPVAAEPTT